MNAFQGTHDALKILKLDIVVYYIKKHNSGLFSREKKDLIDLYRDMVCEIGLDCNSTELNDLYSELCNGLKSIKTSKSLNLKIHVLDI